MGAAVEDQVKGSADGVEAQVEAGGGNTGLLLSVPPPLPLMD